jgi:hypothetical protein
VQGRPLDPLVSVIGAWEGIVGREIAQNTRPQQLVGGTLIVVTSSSAWSQQLAFLEPSVLEALGALPESCRVGRLRFRVGRVQPRGSPRPVGVGRPAPAARRPTDPHDDLGDPDPVARLRERIARANSQATAHCGSCGVGLEGGTSCAPCAFAERRNRLQRAGRLMYETPWLGFEAIATHSGGLDQRDCEEVRRELLRRWWELLARAERTGRLRSDGFERRIASSYLLLQSGLEPDQVSRAAMRNLLGDRLEALLFGASETPPGSRT